jgi:CubicO group peptidase (beta-lactamase class C family)
VLQDVLESETRESAETFIQERVFRPLGMVHSSYAPLSSADQAAGHVDALSGLLSRRVGGGTLAIPVTAALILVVPCLRLSGRTWRRHRVLPALTTIALRWMAASVTVCAAAALVIVPTEPRSGPPSLPSSLQTTVEDLARFAQELVQPRLVRAATRDLLFAPQADVDADLEWGAGIGIDRSTRPTTYWQWGSNPGFQSLLVVEPRHGDAIVVLTNRGTLIDLISGRGGYGAAKQIARRALGINGRWDLYRRAPAS